MYNIRRQKMDCPRHKKLKSNTVYYIFFFKILYFMRASRERYRAWGAWGRKFESCRPDQ
jgi:hypothetical protein